MDQEPADRAPFVAEKEALDAALKAYSAEPTEHHFVELRQAWLRLPYDRKEPGYVSLSDDLYSSLTGGSTLPPQHIGDVLFCEDRLLEAEYFFKMWYAEVPRSIDALIALSIVAGRRNYAGLAYQVRDKLIEYRVAPHIRLMAETIAHVSANKMADASATASEMIEAGRVANDFHPMSLKLAAEVALETSNGGLLSDVLKFAGDNVVLSRHQQVIARNILSPEHQDLLPGGGDR